MIADAMSAPEAKRVQLSSDAAPAPMLADDGDTKSVSVIINNHNGLHVRPASKLVAALAGFNADLLLEKNGSASNRTASTKSRYCRSAATISACWPAVRMPTRRWRRFRRWPPITSVNACGATGSGSGNARARRRRCPALSAGPDPAVRPAAADAAREQQRLRQPLTRRWRILSP